MIGPGLQKHLVNPKAGWCQRPGSEGPRVHEKSLDLFIFLMACVCVYCAAVPVFLRVCVCVRAGVSGRLVYRHHHQAW